MKLTAATKEQSQLASAEAGDARRFPRKAICLLGRYTLGTKEYPCQTLNLSVGGAALFAPVQGRPGDSIILHIDRIGRLEGKILRLSRGGFAVEFTSLLTAASVQQFFDGLQQYNQ